MLVVLSSTPVQAVPLLLNFQGRVTVDGTVFSGTGQFKFALVNAGGSQSYWSNAGSSSAGAEPVANGNYSLHLGDTGLANMGALQAAVFANDPIYLRIWFSDGTNGFERLGTEDNRITSVAFALKAKDADTVTTTTLGQSDVGTTITVTASYIDDQGTAESSISAATASVASASGTSVTQAISLVQGWNLVSLHTQPADMSPSSIFTGHLDVIEEMRTLQSVFNGSWQTFLNTIHHLDLASSYWIKSNAARSGIQVTGTPPTSTVINLAKGWNLIGFPSVGAQDTGVLFKPLSDKNVIERIIGTGDFYTFDPNALFNSLDSLKPGEGYWVKMNEADTLTVTSVAAGDGQNGGRSLAKADGKTKLEEMKKDLVVYPSVPAICIIEIRANGKKATAGSLLAAYVGDELRGVQEVRYLDGEMIVPVVIQTSQTADVRFRFWNAGLSKWFEITERVEVGSGDSLGMGDGGKVVLNVTFPWPSGPELTLLGEVQLTIDQGTTYVDAGASATDNVDGDLTGKIEVSGAVDTSSRGTYTLKYDVSDAAGNAAESVSRTVVVEKATVVQTLDLKEGWNLISFYVVAEDMTPTTVLGSVTDSLVQIKNLKNSYNPTLPAFINTLKGLNVADGYWMKVDADVSFDLEGEVPAGGSIPVNSGWNLLGYPRENGAAPKDELTSLGGTVLQFKNLKDSYSPTLPSFINTLKVITPGLGYWLKVSEDGVWNVGDVSRVGGNRDISKLGLDESRWGVVVVCPNVSATVLAQVTVEGKAVSTGSAVGAFVKEELRGMQEVVLANGRSYVAINVNLANTEKVSYRIWHAENEREYGVIKTMTLEMGETYGTTAELLKLDGVSSDSRSTIQIVGYLREPFGFGFESQSGRHYVVEATNDLKQWGVVKSYNGTGTLIRFEDDRDQVFSQIYYRVRVVE